jgi:hypothetical protein
MSKADKYTGKKKTLTASTKRPKTSSPEAINARPLDINKRPAPKPRLPNVLQLSSGCFRLLWSNRWVFIGIVLIYGIINFTLARGFSSGVDPASFNSQVNNLFHGQFKQIDGGLTVLALMLSSVGSSNSSGGGGFAYEMVLIILVSLALIWAIRSASNNSKVKIKEAYYRGMYPLVPFMGVILVICLELLPMLGGLAIYGLAVNNGIAINAPELLLFAAIALVLSCLSAFWLSSSLFALYIVTLPDMTPIKALRSAKKLVKKRRLAVLGRLVYLPLMLLIVLAIIMLPFILVAPSIAQWVFMLIGIAYVAVVHTYLYNLYRELLVNEQR